MLTHPLPFHSVDVVQGPFQVRGGFALGAGVLHLHGGNVFAQLEGLPRLVVVPLQSPKVLPDTFPLRKTLLANLKTKRNSIQFNSIGSEALERRACPQ